MEGKGEHPVLPPSFSLHFCSFVAMPNASQGQSFTAPVLSLSNGGTGGHHGVSAAISAKAIIKSGLSANRVTTSAHSTTTFFAPPFLG